MSESMFYTTRELTDILKVTERTLLRWRKDGDGPAFVKINGSVRYPKKALDEYIEALKAVR